MAWPKGKPRPPKAGRQPGSVNKSTSFLIAVINRGENLYDAMVEIAFTELDPYKKFTMLEKIANYIAPKQRAFDVNITELNDHELAIEVKRRMDLRQKMLNSSDS